MMSAVQRRFCTVFLAFSAAHLFAAEVDPQKATLSPDGKTLWFDCRALVEGKGWSDTKSPYDRLPAKAEGKVTAAVWDLSHHSAGLCIRFTTDAPSIQVRWALLPNVGLAMPHMPATGVSGIDLYSRDPSGQWSFVGNGRPTAAVNTASFRTSPGQVHVLYLPLYNGVTSVEIGIPKSNQLATPDPAGTAPPKPVIFYGTSITQGGCASRPGLAFTAIVGRKLNLPVINLGFSGSGKMEPAMAELLAELDPSAYVLDCLWNMTPDQVGTRLEPFVRALRAARPEVPIWLAEDSNVKNICPTEKGKIVREIHQKLAAEGMKSIHFLANQGMLGADTEGTVDGCHPNDLGMMRQADAFVKAMAPLLPARN